MLLRARLLVLVVAHAAFPRLSEAATALSAEQLLSITSVLSGAPAWSWDGERLLGLQIPASIDDDWIDRDVAPLATEEEVELFRRLDTDRDRARFAEIFWLRRDPNRATPGNELRAEYERRLGVANDRFRARTGPGSRSEMGRIFLLLGFPKTLDTGRGPAIEIQGGTDPATLEGSTTELVSPLDRGTAQESPASQHLQRWTYPPDTSVERPEGFEVEFRAQAGYGYRLVRNDDVDSLLALKRRALIARPELDYVFDDEGHLAPPSVPPPGGPSPSPAQSVLDGLIAGGASSADVSFGVEPAFFRASAGSVYVPLLFEIDPEDLSWSGGTADVVVFGAVQPLEGGPAEQFEHRTVLARESSRFELPLQLRPGNYLVRLGVLDEAGGRHGSRVTNLQVPGYGGGGLALSSVVVHSGITRTDEPPGTPGHAFQFGALKLATRRDSSFRRTESLGLFYYVYHAEGEREITNRYVFFREDQEVAQTEPKTLLSANGQAIATDEIPLASFSPGEYRVVIRVRDVRSDEEIETSVRFRLEP